MLLPNIHTSLQGRLGVSVTFSAPKLHRHKIKASLFERALANVLGDTAMSARLAKRVHYPSKCPPVLCKQWVLSLSHSETAMAAAAINFPGARLGIDIESHVERDFKRLSEYVGWGDPSHDCSSFYRRWTFLESMFKAQGSIDSKLIKFIESKEQEATQTLTCKYGENWWWITWFTYEKSSMCDLNYSMSIDYPNAVANSRRFDLYINNESASRKIEIPAKNMTMCIVLGLSA